MPVHKCDWSSLEATIRKAERKGETVTQIVDAPADVLVITAKSYGFEVRGETGYDAEAVTTVPLESAIDSKAQETARKTTRAKK